MFTVHKKLPYIKVFKVNMIHDLFVENWQNVLYY